MIFLQVSKKLLLFCGVPFLWGPIFVGAPVWPHMLNMPKSASKWMGTVMRTDVLVENPALSGLRYAAAAAYLPKFRLISMDP